MRPSVRLIRPRLSAGTTSRGRAAARCGLWRQPILWGLVLVCGCDRAPDQFAVNRVFARNQKLARSLEDFSEPLVRQRLDDIQRAVARYFGTPADPRVPAQDDLELGALFESAGLRRAVGADAGEGERAAVGLYRNLCERCHGRSGDGCGPSARSLNPYPRDYRRGLFKFKRTPSTLPPTGEDLHRVLQRGVPETAMPSFRSLTDSQRDVLVQYVRYLSIRGLFERAVISEVVVTLDDDQRLLDPKQQEISPTAYARQVKMLDEILADVVQPWLDADQHVTVVPPPPADYSAPHSVARGRQWFFTTLTNCGQCHGDTALGDGQTEDYDEWSKELAPTTPETLADYLALGALPPRFAEPRNLRIGTYRGGDAPEDLFVKLKNGIAGTTMTSVATQLSDEEIWYLVAYARSLPSDPLSHVSHVP